MANDLNKPDSFPGDIFNRRPMDQLSAITQKLKLICSQCGKRATYDVGAVFSNREDGGKSPNNEYQFTKYFRCRSCGSPGPWTIHDFFTLAGALLRGALGVGEQTVFLGTCQLFDGTSFQTPAMGEEYLLGLIEKDPGNAFLHTRLANLYRGSGMPDRAVKWYEKAVGLDHADVEAHYNLVMLAVKMEDNARIVRHTRPLVRCLLAGCGTNRDDLTEGIAYSISQIIRNSPEQYSEVYLRKRFTGSELPEDLFIRSLLEMEGDEEEIVADAANCLLEGNALPVSPGKTGEIFRLEDFAKGDLLRHFKPKDEEESKSPGSDDSDGDAEYVESLKQALAGEGLRPGQKPTVALGTNDHGEVDIIDPLTVPVSDGEKIALWSAPSLRDLFRGDVKAPAMDRYPPEYAPHFLFIERHLLTFCDVGGDRTDQEMEKIYAALRRRPDGKCLVPVHAFMRQVAALLLGVHPLSQSEYEAIFGQLVKSARRWAIAPVSRNYIGWIRSELR